MRILISNDDGFDAPGIVALAGAVADLGEVVVVAPDTVQSGAGHGITVHHPLTVQREAMKVSVGGEARSLEGFRVDGRPADGVRLAVKTLTDKPFDLVLSGINQGANDGICVFYSGTVAAAAEAAILGIPAVAFSASFAGGSIDYNQAATYCRWVLGTLLADGFGPGDLVNVNIPNLHKPGWPKGVRVVRMSTAELDDAYILLDDGPDRQIYKVAEEYNTGPGGADSDSIALKAGYITVTPLRVDMTWTERLAGWAEKDWGELPSED